MEENGPAAAASVPAATVTPPQYRERLTAAWWLWPLAAGLGALVVAELGMGVTALRHPAAYLAAVLLAVAAVAWLSRIQIRLGDGELRVDDARVPVALLSGAECLDPEQRRDLLGVDADPLAFIIQRPWVPTGVRVNLADPDDPTPYWYVSSRRPEALAAAINSAVPAGPAGVPDPCAPRPRGAASPGD